MFANKNPPRGQHEAMTAKDPLDFVDFVEVGAGKFPLDSLCYKNEHHESAFAYCVHRRFCKCPATGTV